MKKIFLILLSVIFYSCNSSIPDNDNQKNPTKHKSCSAGCSNDEVCFQGFCQPRQNNNGSANNPSGSNGNQAGVSLDDLACVSSTITMSFPLASNSCMGDPTCGDKGVCALCQKPCIGELYVDCDYSKIPNYQSAESFCSDGLDNDCDGTKDCFDSDCALVTSCLCPFGDSEHYQGTTETFCGDGHDNDCDNKIDCADEDCVLTEACAKDLCEFQADGLTVEDIQRSQNAHILGKLILHYAFDENFQDSSENGVHLNSQSSVNFETGKKAQAASFDGISSFIVVPYVDTVQKFTEKSFTLEVWIKTSGNNSTTASIDESMTDTAWNENKDKFIESYSGSQTIFGTNYDDASYSFLGHDDSGILSFGVTGNVNSWTSVTEASAYGTGYSGLDIRDNQWHHVVAVKDVELGQARLYVDGKCAVAISGKTGVDYVSPYKPYYIGASNFCLQCDVGEKGWPISLYKGLIDELKIYDYAFTTQEAKNAYEGN